MATGIARGHGDMRVLVADRALPQGDPTTLPPRPDPLDPAEQEPTWIFFSSGTTAEPKGVLHTDGSLLAAARGLATRLALIERDRNALVFPVTHVGGVIWVMASLLSGCSNIVIEAFDADRTPDVLGREGVTLAGSGTFFHQAYLARQRRELRPLFGDVRAFPGGGAPKPPTLGAELREVFDAPVVSGYGSTEAPIVTMGDVADRPEDLDRTEGRPVPGVELRIVDLSGRLAGPGEEGEIRVRGPQVMRGYLDPSLEADAFDEDGFLRTGDLGRLDERGNLEVTGRLKDVIIRKGENVSAKEVEDLLHEHDKVADVAVVGVPDPESGERVCAVIQLAAGGDDVTADELIIHLRERGLIAQKLPEQVEFVDALPRNASGKVLKHVLRDEFKG
jgi:acyl-CoA synthetase (AMP-forming)/AMP-acid ligase II